MKTNRKNIAIQKIRRQLKIEKFDCLILTKPANVTYTTGFSGDDSWTLITPTNVYLLTDSRYTEQAKGECKNCKIIERKDTLPKEVCKLIGKQKSICVAAVENSASIAVFENLKKKLKVRLKSVADIVENVRTCKSPAEIAAIKTAAQIAAEALAKTVKFIKTGITENQLAGMLDFQIRSAGAVNSFDTIVAFGANASRPHHKPGGMKLKKNDTILFDFGAKYNGLCCDITRCITIGKPSPFYRKVYDAVKQAQAAAIKLVKDGVEISAVDSAARKIISENNLPVYGHGTGHGLGLEIHEAPIICAKAKENYRLVW